MASIDLQLNKDLLIRREDIIETVRTNIIDGEILDDIVENIEHQIKSRCKDLARISIPFVGTLVPNEAKLFKVENHAAFSDKRRIMSKEEYEEFRIRFSNERYKKKRGFRTKTITINRTIRNNRTHATRMLKKYNNTTHYRMYFYFFAFMSPHPYAKCDYVDYDEYTLYKI